MQEYQDIVGDSLAVASVGGSDACKAVVVDGHSVIGNMILTQEGRTTLAQAFNFCNADTALSTEAAAGEWAGSGVIEVPSQENDPSCTSPACDIGSICATLLTPVDGTSLDQNVARLAAVSALQNRGQCLLGLSDESMATVHESVLFDVYYSARSWPYQTCTEFGFYQTCEIGSRCPFVQGYHNLSSSVAMCKRMFGLDESFVQAQVDFSNAYYGGATPAASRILFPNGNVDP
jgi:thymus-specific serine protease